MKVYVFLFLIFFTPIVIFGQSVYVEYEKTVTVDGIPKFRQSATLTANTSSSLYTIYMNKKVGGTLNSDFTESSNEEGETVFTRTSIANTGNESKILIDKKSDTIIQSLSYNKDDILIKDHTGKFHWVITEETKLINDFKCYKAQTRFRGRDFIAWFTNDIPISFGPKKFNGLPGLILSVYDKDKLWQWNATTIKFPVIIEDENHFFSLDQSKYNIYNLREFVAIQEGDVAKGQKLIMSKMPKGTKTIKSKTGRKGLELVYEWELEREEKEEKD